MDQLTKELVDKCLYELKKPTNQAQLEQYLLEPGLDYLYEHLFTHLYSRLFPFLRVLSALYLLIIVLLILIIYLILRKRPMII